MENHRSDPQGLWLPLITPFRDGALDEHSVRRIVKHYLAMPIDGLILGATTGEGLTLDEWEVEQLVSIASTAYVEVGKRLPLYVGLTGSDTRKVVGAVERMESWPIDGYLIACPYYSRPSQDGLLQHFSTLADSTVRPIIIYNIPYRTGVNLNNDTMMVLAERANVVGVKDCCADPKQSFELLRHRPDNFAVLTGEDVTFYDALTYGVDGGILASAHIQTQAFANVFNGWRRGNQKSALCDWHQLVDLPRLLFSEPSVASIKYWLWRIGLIASPEVRLPLTPVSKGLAHRIDREIERVTT